MWFFYWKCPHPPFWKISKSSWWIIDDVAALHYTMGGCCLLFSDISPTVLVGNFERKLLWKFVGEEILLENFCWIFFWWEILAKNFWWKIWKKMPYLISLNLMLFKNIAYIGSWKHSVFVFVCVCVSLSFCMSSSWSLSSLDNKLTENIWFVWSRTSYSGDKWRCFHAGQPKREDRAGRRVLQFRQYMFSIYASIFSPSSWSFLILIFLLQPDMTQRPSFKSIY